MGEAQTGQSPGATRGRQAHDWYRRLKVGGQGRGVSAYCIVCFVFCVVHYAGGGGLFVKSGLCGVLGVVLFVCCVGVV